MLDTLGGLLPSRVEEGAEAMGVLFLASALLAALGLAALPPIIHLISKRRARRVPFGAIEFVLRSQKRTTRSLRLRQVWLLALRILLVAMVVLAVARPVYRETPRAAGAQPPRVVVFVLDESASMHARLDGVSAFERAREQAMAALRKLPDDVRFALLGCGEGPRDLVAEPTFERSLVLGVLREWRAGYGRSDVASCLRRAGEVAARVPGEGERRVLVFTDLAAHALGARSAGAAPEGLVVEWVRAHEGEPPPNHGVRALSVERVPNLSEDSVQIQFSASQFGGVRRDVPVDLRVGNARAARLSLPLFPGARLERSFTHDFGSPQQRSGDPLEVTIELADDALAIDNALPVPVDLPAPVRVLLVDGAPQPIPFQDEVFYLQSALRPTKRSIAQLRVEVLSVEQLHAAALADARVVVLANVSRLTPTVAAALVQFVRAGGGLWITAGDALDIASYHAHLLEILPGRLRGAKGQALLGDAAVAETLGLGGFAQDHPIFRGIARDDAQGLPGLRRVQTDTVYLLEPEADAPREVLMRFSNEAPALVERRVDAGRVIFLATTIDRDWTDLPIRPGYLPLVQQTVLYLAGALDVAGPRFLTVGDERTLIFPRGAASLEVRAPDGEVHRFAERDAAADEVEGALAVRFRATDQPGLYRVRVQYPGGEARELPTERFSVAIDAAESDLRLAEASALEEVVPVGARVRGGSERDSDTPLWPFLLWAALSLLVLESASLRRN